MSTEGAVCCGCCLQPNWVKEQNTYFGQFEVGNPSGLTTAEKDILIKLANAWTEYLALETKESNIHEFNDAIHRCQQLIALRVARRVDPEIWAS